MANAVRIAGQLRRQTLADLEALACDVETRYRHREYECKTVPFNKRDKVPYRRPKTALIALVAQRAYLKRQVVEMIETKLCFTDTLEEDVQDLVSIRGILGRIQTDGIRGTNLETA